MFRTVVAGAAAAALTAAAAVAAEAPLKIVSIDVEGGAATLYVTPQGQSLLIDTGWPAGAGGPRQEPGAPPPPPTSSSAQRIAAAIKAAGLSKLDYLVISHYHLDHIGGAQELMSLVPIDTFVDHGPNRQETRPDATPAQIATSTAALYAQYEAAIAGKKRIVMKAGDRLQMGDLTFTAINSDAVPIAAPVAGGGGAGVGCDSTTSKDAVGGEENPRSLGLLGTWGKARILSLADTTWNVENRLVCPTNLIGKVDLMFVDNHGTDISNSPTLLHNVRPTVAFFNNGPTKGADAAVLERVAATPGVKAIWQLHLPTRSPDKAAPIDHIANVADPDTIHPLTITVTKAGDVTLANPRTGRSQTYPKGS
jgi:beta-lactamase superfamily II metal-dependent hydrolase